MGMTNCAINITWPWLDFTGHTFISMDLLSHQCWSSQRWRLPSIHALSYHQSYKGKRRGYIASVLGAYFSSSFDIVWLLIKKTNNAPTWMSHLFFQAHISSDRIRLELEGISKIIQPTPSSDRWCNWGPEILNDLPKMP